MTSIYSVPSNKRRHPKPNGVTRMFKRHEPELTKLELQEMLRQAAATTAAMEKVE